MLDSVNTRSVRDLESKSGSNKMVRRAATTVNGKMISSTELVCIQEMMEAGTKATGTTMSGQVMESRPGVNQRRK